MINGERQPYLGANVSPTIVSEIAYRELLDDGERLLAVFDGMLLEESGRRVGGLAMTDYLLVTDKQLLTWARGLWTDAVDGFAWKNFELLDAECWDPYHGRLVFSLRVQDADRPQRRVTVRNTNAPQRPAEPTVVNILDMMPAEDVAVATEMLQWIPEFLQAEDVTVLATVFADTFPAIPRQPRQRLAPAPMLPPPDLEEEEKPRKGWFFGLGKSSESEDVPTPGYLVSSYEQRRPGGPVAEPMGFGLRGGQPQIPEQPTVYDISRGLRIIMGQSGRLTGVMQRLSGVVGGAADLVEGMRDPDVRRVAGAGLRQVMSQEGQPSMLRTVARSLLRRSDGEAGARPPAERGGRRIEVRMAARQGAVIDSIDDEEAAPARQAMPEHLRRRVTVARAEPVAGSGVGSVAETPEPTIERMTVPIRRVSRVSRVEEAEE